MLGVFSVNFFAVFVTALAYWLLGSLWFCLLFGKPWAHLIQKHGIKLKDPTKGEMAWKFVTTFILNFIVALGVAFFVHALNVTSLSGAISLGLILGICFTFSTIETNYLWESRPFKLVLIDMGYPILGIILSAIILTYWR